MPPPRLAACLALLLLTACGSGPPASAGSSNSTQSRSGPPSATAAITPTPSPPTATPGHDASADWTTYHRDPGRSGVDPGPASSAAPRQAWSSPTLDGDIYGEPLLLGRLVVVATESDSLYGLDRSTGSVVWQRHVGAPVSRDRLPCGDIFPLGITGTPVADPATGTVYAVAEEAPGSHHLVGVDAATGALRSDRVIDPPGMIPLDQQQRAALTLTGGMVVVAFGGLYGDCGEYHGWVVGAREDGTGPLLAYRVPGSGEAGIWASSGPAVDASGGILVTTGNASSTTSCEGGNSVLRLTPGLTLEAAHTPANCVGLNRSDADLGSTGPILLDRGRAAAIGKEGVLVILDAIHLGAPLASEPICPAFGGDAYAAPLLYLPCSDGVAAVDVSGGTPRVIWRTPLGRGGPPILSGGSVWDVDWGRGRLVALAPADGAVRFSLDLGRVDHFVSPSASGGLVTVAAGSHVVAVTTG